MGQWTVIFQTRPTRKLAEPRKLANTKTLADSPCDSPSSCNLESHFCEANYLLRDKRQASRIIYPFGKDRDKNLSVPYLNKLVNKQVNEAGGT